MKKEYTEEEAEVAAKFHRQIIEICNLKGLEIIYKERNITYTLNTTLCT